MKTIPYDKLEDIREALMKCMKCGNCMAVCPVYLTEKEEAAYARGKLSIAEAILQGDLDLKDEDVQVRCAAIAASWRASPRCRSCECSTTTRISWRAWPRTATGNR